MTRDFVTNMFIPGMLHCTTVRARVARGRVLSVRTPKLPREITIITAADIPGETSVAVGEAEVPVLAAEHVSYYGEPVALLVGPDPEELALLAEETVVEVDTQEPVYEPDADDEDHLAAERRIEIGDAAGELANAYQIVQGEYRTSAQEHMYSEPLAALATWEDDSLAVYTATQWAHHTYRSCSSVLAAEHHLVVHVTPSEEHLDGKLWQPSLVAARAALAAHITKRTVRLAYSAPEDFLYTSKRAPMFASYAAGLDSEGNIRALRIRLVFNMGAYPLFAQELVDRATLAATGSYRCRHVTVRSTALQSNLPPLNALVGLGSSQAFFALESHTARIAELAQVPPHIWKQRNMRVQGEKGITKTNLQRSADSARIIAETSRRADFQRKHAAYELQKKRRPSFTSLLNPSRGIGFAFASQGSGFVGRGEREYPSKVRVRVASNGTVHLSCPSPGTTSALALYWRHSAAEILSVDRDHVIIEPCDSTTSPDAGPAFLSRNITVITQALENACKTAAGRRRHKALPFEVSRSYRLPRSLRWDQESFTGTPFLKQAHAAAAVELEVDPLSLVTRVRAVWMTVDAGRIINREAALQAIERGIFQSLGWASTENVSYYGGAVRYSDYERFGPEARAQSPELSVEFLHVNAEDSACGIAELPFSCVPAAYAAAIRQATGTYVDRLPVTPSLLESYLGET
ncbi:MAG: xanthine dehydrogenase family protein molybdopterin-binding subunit [Spirochaetota bacterium]